MGNLIWAILRLLFRQSGITITDKIKTGPRHCASGFPIQNHPILNDVCKVISDAPYGCAHSLIADRQGVTITLWNDNHPRTFRFSSYGYPDLSRNSDLMFFSAVLKDRIPCGHHYTLIHHMREDDVNANTFHLDHVAFKPTRNLPIPALQEPAADNGRPTQS